MTGNVFHDLPPELDGVVHRFEDRMADVRTRLIRQRAELDAATRPEPASAPVPVDHFDFAHPISSGVRR